MKKKMLIVSLIALLLLGACAKAPAQIDEYKRDFNSAYGSAAVAPEMPNPGSQKESLLMDEALLDMPDSSAQERLVIRTAE
ncbi:MAG: hypothetical protein GX884_03645, partial [Chloroflexi bacterium]|nr:hypothetical protein [Chloroflexota bacterium]